MLKTCNLPLLGLTATLLVGGAPLLAKAPKAPALQQSQAQKTIADAVKVTSVEGITEYRLANGMRVLLFPDSSKPTITVNITYLVGSRHENYGETGMAHLLEHLVFKGSPKHQDIPKELTEHGARPNGSTSTDRTNYFESFQATDENLRWALDLESDRMVNSFISKKDLWNPDTQKGEMSVVRNEFEMGENQPTAVLFERILETAYLWHNYGKPTIGCRADIENVDEARLQAFYRNYYQPDNAVLLVAGKIDEAKTLQLIQERFGVIPKPQRSLQPTYTTEPVQDGERQVTVRRVGDVFWAGAGYHIPSGTHPDFAAVEVLTQILGDTPTGRLHKSLVETKKATAAFGWPMQTQEAGFLLFGMQVSKDGNFEETKDAFLKLLEDPATFTFTPEEVERAKAQLLKQVDLAMNDANRVGLYLSEFIALGDWRAFFLDRDHVKAITPADVERVAKAYLKPSNRTLGQFIPTPKPDRAEIPATPNLADLVKDYKGQAAVAQGEAFNASPMAIEPRIKYSTAPSGLKLAVIPKKTRGASVNFQISVAVGDEKSLMGKSVAGTFAMNMLMKGTAKHTRAQIADLLDKAKAEMSIGGNCEAAYVRGQTDREHLPEVLRLLAEILKEPAFPEQEFEMQRQQWLAGIDQQRTEPTALASRAFQRALSSYPQGHPLYTSTLDESVAEIKALKLEDVKAFHQTFFGTSGTMAAIVGDVDAKEVQQLVNELFGQWKSPTPYTYIPRGYKAASPQNLSIETPDKANAMFLAGMQMPLQDTDPDYPALRLANFMLGGGFINSRLATRIRQKEGLSYSVGSQLDSACVNRSSTWSAYAIYAPQNLARLEAAFQEELARALKDGFTNEEIKAAKSAEIQGRQVSRSQDNELAALIEGNLKFNRTLAYDVDLEKKLSDLTNEQIVAALRKYLDPSKLVVVKAGDFAKAAKEPVSK